MNDAQNLLGSASQTQNPQSSSSLSVQQQSNTVQSSGKSLTSLNTSGNGISLNSVPNTTSATLSAPATQKNYAPYIISGVLLAVVVVVSFLLMRAYKKQTPAYKSGEV